jgi:hypothetical protein
MTPPAIDQELSRGRFLPLRLHFKGGMMLRISLLLITLLGGCAETNLERQSTASSFTTSPTESAYVSVPRDGVYGEDTYQGSGQTTAQAIVLAFNPYLERVEAGSTTEDFAAAIRSADSGRFTYLIYPQILHWEDRATEWSGKPDRISIKLSVYNVATGNLADSVLITGHSAWATLGGDKPQDLLADPLAKYAKSLRGQ